MGQKAIDETDRLLRLRAGDRAADEALFQRIYDDLRGLAAREMRGQPANHTLQPTALAHEVYLRLIDGSRVDAGDRRQFLALAARAMRSILVDHARRRTADKRGGGVKPLPFDEALDSFEARSVDLTALDDALADLAVANQRQARIVELRFFGGMTNEEVGAFLGISLRTVEREWRLARAWLWRDLADDSDELAS